MTDAVRDSYDARAKEYADLFIDDLDCSPHDQEWLRKFAELVSPGTGRVADLGCGPGHIVDHLAHLNLKAIGYDIAPSMVKEARRAFPESEFQIGDLMSLDIADATLSGIVARYSVIHLLPEEIPNAFSEWFRVLEPEAPLLVQFFAARSPADHGLPFDHAVATAYALCPETIAAQMQAAGFDRIETETRPPPAGGRPLNQGTLLARR